ncbi:MAG: hypothetical protein K2W85_13960, partial [Phycisphaerales bacterium]|nr:hypothetical protein [Phycisphaerales bacterium]
MKLYVALCAFLVLSSVACAGVNIRYRYQLSPGVDVEVDTSQPGPNFTVNREIFHNNATRRVTSVLVWTDSPTTEDLGVMTLSPAVGQFFLPILLRTPQPGGFPACRNWSGNWDGNVSTFQNAGVLVGISGEINGNLIGSVAANQINGLGVRGRVIGHIRSRGQDDQTQPGLTLLELAAVDSGATIVSESTGLLQIAPIATIALGTTRDMDGSVSNNSGNVFVRWDIGPSRWRGNITVPNGRLLQLDLGSSGSIVARPGGPRPSIVVKNTIDQIQAASIDADIQVTEQSPSAPEPIGYIQRIEALNGSISGSISCRRFSLTTGGPLPNVGGVRATGALSASLTSVIQDTALQVSEVSSSAMVRTGRFASTLGDIMLLDAMGLKGQIILNQTLSFTPAQAWGRPIKVGTQTINNTLEGEYELPSAQLGGGAVGLAPFRLYRADSVPTATAPGA